MTPKEKAEELIDRFYFDTLLNELEDAKDCALIAVDEIIEELSYMWLHYAQFEEQLDERVSYYEEVKQEIEKL